MEIEKHIEFWKKQSLEDWETAVYLAKGNRNLMALFAIHLSIEKLLKAHWIKDNLEKNPPRTHDLQFLYKQTDVELSPDQYGYLATLTGWNLEGRYPDYKEKINRMATPAFVAEQMEKAKGIKECLLEKLQNA
jgi:HEPN domain-containing protein